MKKQSKAAIYALLAAIMWSTVATAFKISLRYISFIELLLISSIVSTLVLGIFFFLSKEVGGFGDLKNGFLKSAFMGFLNPFLYYLILFKAYTLLPAQEAQPLNYTWGIVVPLLSVPLLGQKLSLAALIALLVSFFGVVIISTHGDLKGLSFTNPAGVSLAVGSSLVWGLYWIFNLKDKREEKGKLFLNFVFGSLFVLVYYLLFYINGLPDTRGLAVAAYVGIFEMGLAFIVWLKALKNSESTALVSNIIYLSPFISLFFIYFVLGEKILLSSVAGLGFIMAGIVVQQYLGKVRRN